MSMKPMKPIKKPQKQININDTEAVKCEECGNYSFIQSFFLKRLSPVMSPTGQETLIPVQVYSCGNCGHINKSLNPTLEKDSQTEKSKFPSLDV